LLLYHILKQVAKHNILTSGKIKLFWRWH